MKFQTRLSILFLVIFMFMFVPACSSANGNSSKASSTSKSNFTAETRIKLDKLEIKPDMISNTLKIKVRLDAGQLIMRLLTPDGEVQWEQTITASATYRKTLNLDATPGTWKLQIETENATGNYDIQWKASN